MTSAKDDEELFLFYFSQTLRLIRSPTLSSEPVKCRESGVTIVSPLVEAAFVEAQIALQLHRERFHKPLPDTSWLEAEIEQSNKLKRAESRAKTAEDRAAVLEKLASGCEVLVRQRDKADQGLAAALARIAKLETDAKSYALSDTVDITQHMEEQVTQNMQQREKDT